MEHENNIELIRVFTPEGHSSLYCVFRVNGNVIVTTEAEYKQIWGKYNQDRWKTQNQERGQ